MWQYAVLLVYMASGWICSVKSFSFSFLFWSIYIFKGVNYEKWLNADLSKIRWKQKIFCFVIPGTAIIINSQVVHKSEKNTSGRSREIYTFHIAESKNTEWSSQNWWVNLRVNRLFFPTLRVSQICTVPLLCDFFLNSLQPGFTLIETAEQMWKLFKMNNKVTRTTPLTLFWCLYS